MSRSISVIGLSVISACTEPEPAPPDVPAIEYCAAVDDWDAELAALELEILDRVNAARAEGAECALDQMLAPAPALTMNAALRCAARVHALDMASQDYFANDDPDGLRYTDRAERAGYAGIALGQNIGAAQHEAKQIVDAMLNSPGLCLTLMDPEATELGVGFVLTDAAEFPSYWTQVYGMGG